MVRVDSPGCRVDGRTTCDRRAHRIASDGRLPSAATWSRATAEGQERDLEEGFTDLQRRPQSDQGRCAGCVSAHSTRPSATPSPFTVCAFVGAGNQLCSTGKTEGRGSAAWQVPAVAVVEEELEHTGQLRHGRLMVDHCISRAARIAHGGRLSLQPPARPAPPPSTLLVVARAKAV